MKNKVSTGIEKIVETYRTAPFGITLGLSEIAIGLCKYENPKFLFVSIYGTIAGMLVTYQQFKLKKRLEESIKDNGYSDKSFKVTTKYWCDRQTASIVAEKCGKEKEYKELYEKDIDRHYPYLPNF